ncbi:MAG: ROK family protein [Bacteroidales bacterium]|nr:ROK family protein [Bacteroidales bacterium]
MTEASKIAIGADIGGSHICCAAIDLSTHKIIHGTYREEKINNKASAEEILGGWSKALSGSLSGFDKSLLAGIGFAMPGPFDYANGIALFKRVEKFDNLYGVNVSEELRKLMNLDASIPFRYINDATAFAIAEAWVGKAGNYDKMIALTLGTGFGSAFVDHGIPVTEGETVAEMGCVWHIPFKDGIADDYFSTRWFIKNFEVKTGKTVHGVKDIADMINTEPAALELFEEYGSNMGHFLAPWIRKFDANVIVMGGNITGAFGIFGKYLQKALEDNDLHVQLLLSDLKEDAAIMGGARLLVEDFWVNVKDLLPNM